MSASAERLSSSSIARRDEIVGCRWSGCGSVEVIPRTVRFGGTSARRVEAERHRAVRWRARQLAGLVGWNPAGGSGPFERVSPVSRFPDWGPAWREAVPHQMWNSDPCQVLPAGCSDDHRKPGGAGMVSRRARLAHTRRGACTAHDTDSRLHVFFGGRPATTRHMGPLQRRGWPLADVHRSRLPRCSQVG